MMKQLLTKTVRKFMIEQLKEQISELNLSREENKSKLFNLYADKAEQKERWLVYGEHTSLEERVTLEADIRDLEAKRQESKVLILRLRKQLREEVAKASPLVEISVD